MILFDFFIRKITQLIHGQDRNERVEKGGRIFDFDQFSFDFNKVYNLNNNKHTVSLYHSKTNKHLWDKI